MSSQQFPGFISLGFERACLLDTARLLPAPTHSTPMRLVGEPYPHLDNLRDSRWRLVTRVGRPTPGTATRVSQLTICLSSLRPTLNELEVSERHVLEAMVARSSLIPTEVARA